VLRCLLRRRLGSWQQQLEQREADAAELEQRATELLAGAREAAAAAVARREGAEARLHEAQLQLQRLETEVDGTRVRLQVGCQGRPLGGCTGRRTWAAESRSCQWHAALPWQDLAAQAPTPCRRLPPGGEGQPGQRPGRP
jgi:hypothetical protein